MAERIVVLDAISESVAQKLRALLPEGFELDHGTAQGDDHLAEIIAEADYAITGQVGVSRDVLQAAQRLKLVHKWGVGVDNIDVAAAREFGIKIARTTGSYAVAVAEFTIGLIVCALRHLAHGHHRMQQREWRNWGGSEPYTLHNGCASASRFRLRDSLFQTQSPCANRRARTRRWLRHHERAASTLRCRLAALPAHPRDRRGDRSRSITSHEAHRGINQRRQGRRRC